MKVAFHTLGCKVNSYESQAVLEQFSKAAFEIVDFSQKADVYIINTCAVTKEASRKSRQMLHRPKKINPNAITVALGCYAQEDKEALIKDDKIDIVIGNNEKSNTLCKVLEYISLKEEAGNLLNKQVNKNNFCIVDDLTHCTDYESQFINNQQGHVRAYVKIQDGCNRFCSYCIIPFLRGRSRSRKEEDILKEVSNLALNGFKEIVVTGIDISMYGLDLDIQPKQSADIYLANLIEKISKIEGIERIRFGSLEVSLITPYFVTKLSKIEKVCPHFHLSLQSGSDSVLLRMNRKYNTKEYLNSINLLKEHFDNPAITTDVIVGFPNESEEEFKETLEFIKEVGFSQIHVFPYSRREGTKADKMEGHLSKVQKAKKVDILIKEAKKLQKEYINSHIGKEEYILIEEKEEIGTKSYWMGFTKEYIKVKICSNENCLNQMVKVKIENKNILAFCE